MATEVLLYLVIVLLIMQVVFIGIVINLQMKHKRMQAKYQIFMRGKDGYVYHTDCNDRIVCDAEYKI